MAFELSPNSWVSIAIVLLYGVYLIFIARIESLARKRMAGRISALPKVTDQMRCAGFESEAWDALADAVIEKGGWPYGCRESAKCVEGIFLAMYAAMLDEAA